MTKQAELRGLFEQVKNAKGPSREIDKAIAIQALGMVEEKRNGERDEWLHDDATSRRFKVVGIAFERLPSYTASLDAALAFTERALPGVKGFSGEPSVGWKFGVYRLTQPGLWTAWVRQHADDGVEVKQRTPALALVAAVLKALIEQESE